MGTHLCPLRQESNLTAAPALKLRAFNQFYLDSLGWSARAREISKPLAPLLAGRPAGVDSASGRKVAENAI